MIRWGGLVIGSALTGAGTAGCGPEGAPAPAGTRTGQPAATGSPAPPPTPAAGPVRRTAGAATVIALEDAAGRFFEPRGDVFPDATEQQWARADRLDPGAVHHGRWWLRFRCYAIQFDGGDTILVDAGVGPAGSAASDWAPGPGRLPEQLAAAGIGPPDVTTVILTHLHDDHIGWAVTDGQPYFPNARYVLQRTEHDRAGGTTRTSVIEPLREVDQLWLVDGETRVTGGLRVVPTPGHTPGHQSVLLPDSDGSATVAVTGDVLVHMVQLTDPAIGYRYESDAATARATREALLADLTGQGAVLATAHLTEPFLVLPVG